MPQEAVRERSISGAPPASLSGQVSWAFFHFAAGPYWIIVNIFVFAAYFQAVVVGDDVRGQEYWGYIQAFAGFAVALLSPVLGATVDARGERKPGFFVFVLLGLLGILSLWFATPGAIALTAFAVIWAAVMNEFAGVYHNAMLPRVATPSRVGFLSGLGYSFDYAGAILVFALWLSLPALVAFPEEGHWHERIAAPLTGLWMLVFMLPLFLFTPDERPTGLTYPEAVRTGWKTLIATIRKASHYRNVALFLVARAIYADGMSAVFNFIGVYVAGVFGWSVGKVGVYALLILVVSAFTSVIGGWIDDKLGSKRTIFISVLGFGLGVLGSVSVSPTHMLFVVPIPPEMASAQLPVVGPFFAAMGFGPYAEQVNLAFAMVGGVFVGPALASSRTMLARLVPPERMAEFYGLYTLTGRATAWLAPLGIGIVTGLTQDQRIGFSVVFVFLAGGLALLALVREERTAAHE